MQRLVGIIFILSWLLCGCTIETFFDGGAPIFLLALAVMIVCAGVMGEDDGDI